MKYYDKIPENFLLIRFVATRYCNYRCPYCYVPLEKRRTKKTMFSHHAIYEWVKAIRENFSDKTLEIYFTGGEPLIIEDCILFIKELVALNNVQRIRIDSNLSFISNLLKYVDSEKVRFLSAFHPTQINLDKYIEQVKLAQSRKMVDIVNFVCSRQNIKLLNTPPHKLIKSFEELGVFFNIARDFYSGSLKGYTYEDNYKRYIDIMQYPLDNLYMDHKPLNKGFLCAGGKHYITINRHGQVFSCGGKIQRTIGHGNIFDSSFKLYDQLQVCEEDSCASIISYSFSCSNQFSPINHTEDYVKRCNDIRAGLSEDYLDKLWKNINPNKIFVNKFGISKFKYISRLLSILK